MDSDDSNISDHVGDLDIQSYQFEPLCNDESQQERDKISSSVQPVDLCYFSFSFNRGFFFNIVNK
jgi:hypothetical protein